MSSGTSYNGWPANSDRSAIGVVSNDWFPGGVKAGDVTTVLGFVARQLNARVEPIVAGWCWGYTYKANVNNPSQLSCHASGTAIDWNAPDHPNGAGGTFTSAQRGQIYAILDEAQGAVSWLEGYDEMHFEICVDAGTLAGVAAILGDAAPPTPPEDDVTDDDIDKIAERVWSRLITTRPGDGGQVGAGDLLSYVDLHTQPGALADTVAEKVWQYMLTSRVATADDGTPAPIAVGDLLTYVDLHTQP